MTQAIVEPVARLAGEISLPGDKSISHRAVLFAALGEGEIRLQNLLEGEDVMATVDCFRALGVSIEKKGEEWVVRGVGLKGLRRPDKILHCGNSGTTLRLLLGVLAAQDFEASLTGDASLNRRPMKRVMDPLTQMGAQFRMEGEGTPQRVLHVRGGPLTAIDYVSPVASAQVKSAILLAGLWASGKTSVSEPLLSRDHTERMMEGFGVSLERQDLRVSVSPLKKLRVPNVLRVPGDFSSAAFFLVAGSLVPGRILLRGLGLNPTRTGALDALRAMGAKIQVQDLKKEGGEELGDLEVSYAPLTAHNLEGAIIPRLIDEIPILAVAAARAKGNTEIRDAAELRVKESDRIKVLCELLGKIGVSVQERADGLKIEGGAAFRSAATDSHGDHRMAMSMAVAALVAQGPLTIENVDCVNTSFPSFWQLLTHLGARVRIC